MNKIITLNDNIQSGDTSQINQHFNPFYRTQVIGGFDHYIDDKGVNRFGEVLFEEENMVLIGGSIFTLEKLFGTRMPTTHMKVSQLADVFTEQGIPHPIGWSGSSTTNHVADNTVCLFGVGIGGAGDSIADIADVKYYQRNISNMVPFRVLTDDSEMSAADHDKYYGRSVNGDLISYYLKKFDSTAIKCKWRDSDNEAEGSDVTSEYYNTSADVTTPIETFIEITLKISKDDVREYFENAVNGENVERARINTIGLFTAVPVTLENPIPVESNGSTLFSRTTEYDQVTCFSCLNFDNEMLALPKELTIVYRIFTK